MLRGRPPETPKLSLSFTENPSACRKLLEFYFFLGFKALPLRRLSDSCGGRKLGADMHGDLAPSKGAGPALDNVLQFRGNRWRPQAGEFLAHSRTGHSRLNYLAQRALSTRKKMGAWGRFFLSDLSHLLTIWRELCCFLGENLPRNDVRRG